MFDLHLKAKVRVVMLLVTAGVMGAFALWSGCGAGGRVLLWLLSLLCAQSCIAFAAVALLMLLRLPEATGKRSDGSLPMWSYVLFWPWMAVHIVWMHLQRRKDGRRSPVATQVAPGLLLSGYPAFSGFEPGCAVHAIVDATCELPGTVTSSQQVQYLCVPVWDGMAPTAVQIGRAADWVLAQRKEGRTVLVHCFHGVGRSATVMCACLVKCGIFASTDQALAHLLEVRPIVKLQDYHLRELAEWGHFEAMRQAAVATLPS